ncbi:MAG: histidine phosphatase family protein [Chitinophagaceae bacterium]|nr:histidine phosphatase family protein [Oligoflexus sp.]
MRVMPCIVLFSLGFTVPLFGFQSIYIVRHAEKLGNTTDPELSTAGQARATSLARILHDSDVGAIFTSEYVRTQKTAVPLAEALKLNPIAIASTKSDVLIQTLKNDTSLKTALVVGHSNTLPEIFKAFGSDQKVEVGENEYDRLYILTPQKSGKPIVNLIRY